MKYLQHLIILIIVICFFSSCNNKQSAKKLPDIWLLSVLTDLVRMVSAMQKLLILTKWLNTVHLHFLPVPFYPRVADAAKKLTSPSFISCTNDYQK